jgi:hypothetical protein
MYYNQLIESYKYNKKEWNVLLNKNIITIISNPYHYEYCDRVLLAKFLEKLGASYIKEIEI